MYQWEGLPLGKLAYGLCSSSEDKGRKTTLQERYLITLGVAAQRTMEAKSPAAGGEGVAPQTSWANCS